MLSYVFFFVILLEHFDSINNIKVGIINNVSLNLPSWSSRSKSAPTLNGTCAECLCAIMTNSSDLYSISSYGIGSFNCFTNNNTCQFFTNGTFYEYWLSNDTNTNVYFLQLPTSIKSFYVNPIITRFIQTTIDVILIQSLP
jgi:type IV secretory pathway TraG/TraD family ATPase VirD4